jgi:4-oxalocrotonate tautomerase
MLIRAPASTASLIRVPDTLPGLSHGFKHVATAAISATQHLTIESACEVVCGTARNRPCRAYEVSDALLEELFGEAWHRPSLQITMLAGRTIEQKRRTVKRVADALREGLNVQPEKLTIAFVEVPRDSYARNGVLLSDRTDLQ